MDLGTIEKKLRKGEYSDPWEYVDDVWLMFDNAWIYNRKTSRVYRYCTKVRYLNLIFKSNLKIFIFLFSYRKSLKKKLILLCKR